MATTPDGLSAGAGRGLAGAAGAWVCGPRVVLFWTDGGNALISRMVAAVRPDLDGGPGVRAWVGWPDGGRGGGTATATPGAASPGRLNSISTPPTCRRVPLTSSAWATS